MQPVSLATPAFYSQFIGWLNQWHNTGASIAIMAWGGADFDDKGYTTKPSGTFTGTTNRDYNFDESYKLMKLKLVNVTYDGSLITSLPNRLTLQLTGIIAGH